MKIKMNQKLLVFLLAISWASSLQAYEKQIEKGPALDAGPNTLLLENSAPPQEGAVLMSWLGGTEAIERILIGTPQMNSNQVEFTEDYVRRRFERSICVNSQKNSWHYAPFTMGTIYLLNGSKINFTMYLSGIFVAGNLFAII